MENYICINGKKVELTEEQMRALGIKIPKANPFERVQKGEKYWTIAQSGKADWHFEVNDDYDDDCFNTANYCTDKTIMEQRALHEVFNRLLWRYSMTHKANRIDDKVWSIKYDYDSKTFYAGRVHYEILFLGEISFDTEEIAEKAINEIIKPFMEAHPEFEL